MPSQPVQNDRTFVMDPSTLLDRYAERLLTGTGVDLDRVLAADLVGVPGAAASALRDGFAAADENTAGSAVGSVVES